MKRIAKQKRYACNTINQKRNRSKDRNRIAQQRQIIKRAKYVVGKCRAPDSLAAQTTEAATAEAEAATAAAVAAGLCQLCAAAAAATAEYAEW